MYFSYSTENLLSALMVIGIATSVSGAATTISPSSQIQNEFTADEVIVTGREGHIEVISRKEFMARINNIPIATATQHYGNFTALEDTDSLPAIEKRCQKQTVFTLDSAETFLDWDVAMSPVVVAPPNNSTFISIDQGRVVGNKLSVSLDSGLGIIKKFMKSSLAVSYDRSWTTDNSVGYNFEVPAGKVGAIVSNPLTTRHSGWVDVGCIGASKRIKFTGDSYRNMVLMQMPWVEGVIGLCIGDTFPLQRCLGNGTL